MQLGELKKGDLVVHNGDMYVVVKDNPTILPDEPSSDFFSLRGITGAKGATGANGATGAKGDNGERGEQGAVGATGAKGERGATGATGAKGATGATGAAGHSPSRGTLFSDVQLGSLKKGDLVVYSGGLYVSLIDNPVNLPGEANSDFISLRGATGSKGATGATGATGAKGTTGATGATGLTGAKGEQGIQGITGAKGATGAIGVKGDTGATGATGAKGSTGATGAKGATGATGAKGDDGDDARQIYRGYYDVNDNADYQRGDLVHVGTVLYQLSSDSSGGHPGTTNGASWVKLTHTGATGAKGATGAAGADGAAGTTGATGATGAQGLVGADGADGVHARQIIQGVYKNDTTYQNGDIVSYRSATTDEVRTYQLVCHQDGCKQGKPDDKASSWSDLQGNVGATGAAGLSGEDAEIWTYAGITLGGIVVVAAMYMMIEHFCWQEDGEENTNNKSKQKQKIKYTPIATTGADDGEDFISIDLDVERKAGTFGFGESGYPVSEKLRF